MKTYAGFDPGGHGRFGWALVSGERFPLKLVGIGIADHAQGAFKAITDCVGNTKINAVGIDAPLFWVPAGERRSDQIVRDAIREQGCKTTGGTVSSVNALRGACLIQGMLVAMKCRHAIHKEISITESHPKALLWSLGKVTSTRRVVDVTLDHLSEYVCGAENNIRGASEHERDAVLGAIAAFAMDSRLTGWQNLYPLELDAVTPLDPAPEYWMPLDLDQDL